MIEIGRSKRALPVFGFDDIAIVPTRRTRGIEEVNLSWRIDALTFDFPIVAAPMDSVMSPATAIAMGHLGGLGVLNLEGLWTRYADPEPLLRRARPGWTTRSLRRKRMQALYAEPIKAELITERMAQIRAAGVPVAGSLSPADLRGVRRRGGEGRASTSSSSAARPCRAEHVSNVDEPLNLKKFIYELDVPVIVGGCATYQSSLHLMRTGAAGVLVGFGGGATQAHPQRPRRRGADGLGARRRRRGPSRLPRRVRWPVRARHRRRCARPLRRHRQGAGLRRGRGHGRLPAGTGDRGAGPGLPLGSRGLARHPAARRAGQVRRDRHAGGDPARARRTSPTAR